MKVCLLFIVVAVTLIDARSFPPRDVQPPDEWTDITIDDLPDEVVNVANATVAVTNHFVDNFNVVEYTGVESIRAKIINGINYEFELPYDLKNCYRPSHIAAGEPGDYQCVTTKARCRMSVNYQLKTGTVEVLEDYCEYVDMSEE